MAPLSTNAISHFMHPAHKLNHLTTDQSYSYLCDGCKVPGTGSCFTCTICSFDLHDYCAKCPTRLTSTTHHQHPLSLLVHKPKTDQIESCQICSNPIKGLAYQCKNCNFWIHPLCVLSNPAHDQDQHRAIPSASAPTGQSQSIGQQVGIGLGTNWVYDQIKDDLPSVGSNASGNSCEVPSAGSDACGVEEAGGGIFDQIKEDLPSVADGASAAAEASGGFFDAVVSGLFSSFSS